MAFVFIVFAVYTGLVVSFIIGYYRIIEKKPIPTSTNKFISIVICFRNEEKNIGNLVQTITNISYPSSDFEIIAVNDHSEDGTLLQLLDLQKTIQNLRVTSLGMLEKGKKSALHKGVLLANGNIIAITDADCSIPTTWLTEINSYMDNHTDMICGPVVYAPQNMFESISAIEFGSLVASGIGSAGVGNPIFCNGANMAFKKELFLAANLNSDITPSGDDVFLLQYAHKCKRNIRFAHGPTITIPTTPDRNLKDLISRRVRWGSKTPYYADVFSKFVATTILATNLLVLLLVLLSFSSVLIFGKLILLLGIKLSVDFGLLSVHFRTCNISRWRRYYPIAAALYPVYVTATALLSFKKEFTWKERIYN